MELEGAWRRPAEADRDDDDGDVDGDDGDDDGDVDRSDEVHRSGKREAK